MSRRTSTPTSAAAAAPRRHYLSPAEAAAYLGVNERTIRRQVAAGKLRGLVQAGFGHPERTAGRARGCSEYRWTTDASWSESLARLPG